MLTMYKEQTHKYPCVQSSFTLRHHHHHLTSSFIFIEIHLTKKTFFSRKKRRAFYDIMISIHFSFFLRFNRNKSTKSTHYFFLCHQPSHRSVSYRMDTERVSAGVLVLLFKQKNQGKKYHTFFFMLHIILFLGCGFW